MMLSRLTKRSTATFDDKIKLIAFKLTRGQPLKGRILDTDQKPFAGVTVALQSWANAPFPKWSTQTDEEGRFKWDAAPAETATYSISKDGYVPLTQDLAPSPGQPADLVLTKVGLISGKVSGETPSIAAAEPAGSGLSDPERWVDEYGDCLFRRGGRPFGAGWLGPRRLESRSGPATMAKVRRKP
jgi:hypothetical protein